MTRPILDILFPRATSPTSDPRVVAAIEPLLQEEVRACRAAVGKLAYIATMLRRYRDAVMGGASSVERGELDLLLRRLDAADDALRNAIRATRFPPGLPELPFADERWPFFATGRSPHDLGSRALLLASWWTVRLAGLALRRAGSWLWERDMALWAWVIRRSSAT